MVKPLRCLLAPAFSAVNEHHAALESDEHQIEPSQGRYAIISEELAPLIEAAAAAEATAGSEAWAEPGP